MGWIVTVLGLDWPPEMPEYPVCLTLFGSGLDWRQDEDEQAHSTRE